MDKEPITLNGLKRLEEELVFLKEKKRPEIVAAISEARSHGDLKENAEYHAAKEEQSHNEGRRQSCILFNYKKNNFNYDFHIVKDVVITIQMIFNNIIEKKIKKKCTVKDKDMQYIKRGIYAEFNLLYYRVTKFCLQTGGNVEGILMSLPPVTKWK